MQGQVVVVTGGSGGIGGAIAALLLREGARVCVTHLHHEPDPGAWRASSEAVIAVRADLSREDDVVRVFAEADRLGTLTGLVNSAAVIGEEKATVDMDAGSLARLWALNITAYMLCAREAIRRMSTRRGGNGGAIVNVSSMAGVRGGSERRVAYGASKGAINAFTLGLGREVVDDGIRVNAVVPGYVETAAHAGPERTERLRRAVQSVPMKRAGRPGEVAEAVLWLLSSKSSFVTSTLVNVAGGA